MAIDWTKASSKARQRIINREAQRMRNRENQRKGEIGEDHALRALKQLGCHELDSIETGFRRGRDKGGNLIMIPKAKVAGDIRGIFYHKGFGISVLAEVKSRATETRDGMPVLSHSDLETHQWEKLLRHRKYNAIAVIVWVSKKGVIVLPPGVPGWHKGRRLRWDDAQQYRIIDLKSMLTN